MWLKDAIKRPSPNRSSRYGRNIEGIVIHYTAGGQNATDWLLRKEAKASAHFVIGRRGEVDQLVSMDEAAWHAGKAEALYNGEMTTNPNLFTIGIELENYGNMVRQDGSFYVEYGRSMIDVDANLIQSIKYSTMKYHTGTIVKGFWEEYPVAQLNALQDTIDSILRIYPNIRYISGHDEIALPTGRKQDPGPLFPMDAVARNSKLDKTPRSIQRRFKLVDVEF